MQCIDIIFNKNCRRISEEEKEQRKKERKK